MHQSGGRVVGIIPGFMASRGLAYAPADELVLTRDMRERKAAMEGRADAFGPPCPAVLAPRCRGNAQIITLKQLHQHSRPTIFLNTDGFYDPLIRLFDHMRQHRFAKQTLQRTPPFRAERERRLYVSGLLPAAFGGGKWYGANEP